MPRPRRSHSHGRRTDAHGRAPPLSTVRTRPPFEFVPPRSAASSRTASFCYRWSPSTPLHPPPPPIKPEYGYPANWRPHHVLQRALAAIHMHDCVRGRTRTNVHRRPGPLRFIFVTCAQRAYRTSTLVPEGAGARALRRPLLRAPRPPSHARRRPSAVSRRLQRRISRSATALRVPRWPCVQRQLRIHRRAGSAPARHWPLGGGGAAPLRLRGPRAPRLGLQGGQGVAARTWTPGVLPPAGDAISESSFKRGSSGGEPGLMPVGGRSVRPRISKIPVTGLIARGRRLGLSGGRGSVPWQPLRASEAGLGSGRWESEH